MTLASLPIPTLDPSTARKLDRSELAGIPNRAHTAALLDDLLEVQRLQARAVEIGRRNEKDRELKMLAIRAINACVRRGVGVMARTRRSRPAGLL